MRASFALAFFSSVSCLLGGWLPHGCCVAVRVCAAAGLQALVVAGSLLYVFSKGAKFSLFKPAEEMVSAASPKQ